MPQLEELHISRDFIDPALRLASRAPRLRKLRIGPLWNGTEDIPCLASLSESLDPVTFKEIEVACVVQRYSGTPFVPDADAEDCQPVFPPAKCKFRCYGGLHVRLSVILGEGWLPNHYIFASGPFPKHIELVA